MELTENQKKHLRRVGHALKPVVMIGQQGLTPGVVAETARALEDHELIKVRARVGDRGNRDAALQDLAGQTGAAVVQRIGNVGLLYKKNSGLPKILLPDY
jgi:RNA-binding protein